MKRCAAISLLTLFALSCFLQIATGYAQEAVPARYMPILQDWNAATAEELRLNIIEYWADIYPGDSHFSSRRMPLNIRFGGTTKELIADQKNWDLAIVSSKDVDLQVLAAEGLIDETPHYPFHTHSLYQWLLPDALQAKLPQDRIMTHYVYFYDYNTKTDDATILICQANIGRKKNNPRSPSNFSEAIMCKRSATIARNVEGIRLPLGIEGFSKYTEQDLLANAEEWDVAVITVDQGDKLELLDRAGLLYDFSQNDYFASRTSMHPSDWYYGDDNPYDEIPNGVFSADGRMIGVPCKETSSTSDMAGKVGMLILNAKSPCFERALAYAVHHMKSKEYEWTTEPKPWPDIYPEYPDYKDFCIYKDEMDW
jgi:hypothetical protein